MRKHEGANREDTRGPQQRHFQCDELAERARSASDVGQARRPTASEMMVVPVRGMEKKLNLTKPPPGH